MRSSPGSSLSNFTHLTKRVPGFAGSDAAAAGLGPQVSSAMRILLEEILPHQDTASRRIFLVPAQVNRARPAEEGLAPGATGLPGEPPRIAPPARRAASILVARKAKREMKIVVGSDHAGFALKKILKAELRRLRHRIVDVGTHSARPVDYPDYAEAVGLALRKGRGQRGILICGSGVGASVAANKLPGIRAGLCHDSYSAHQGVEHDDMNVLVLGARVIGVETAKELVHAFLRAKFTRESRHRRRLKKILELERKYDGGANARRTE